MPFPTTAGNLPANHASGQTITSANQNAVETDVNALTAKAGTGTSTPAAGTVLTGTGTGTSAWQAPSTGATLVVTPVSTNYTVQDTDDIVIVTSGTVTITLPSPTTALKRFHRIKNTGTGTVTIGGFTVDGQSPTLIQFDALTVLTDGTNWGGY